MVATSANHLHHTFTYFLKNAELLSMSACDNNISCAMLLNLEKILYLSLHSRKSIRVESAFYCHGFRPKITGNQGVLLAQVHAHFELVYMASKFKNRGIVYYGTFSNQFFTEPNERWVILINLVFFKTGKRSSICDSLRASDGTIL